MSTRNQKRKPFNKRAYNIITLNDERATINLHLWTYKLVEIMEKEHGTPLETILKYWQILEYRTYQRLKDLKLRFKVNQPYCDNLLKSCDFTVYSSKGSIIKLVECKFINCSRVYNVPSFIKSVMENNIKSDHILYVVNRSFYSLLKRTNMLRENITTISGLKYHLLDLPNNTLSNNINYQMSKNSYKNA
jgi:hypothetical protein